MPWVCGMGRGAWEGGVHGKGQKRGCCGFDHINCSSCRGWEGSVAASIDREPAPAVLLTDPWLCDGHQAPPWLTRPLTPGCSSSTRRSTRCESC